LEEMNTGPGLKDFIFIVGYRSEQVCDYLGMARGGE